MLGRGFLRYVLPAFCSGTLWAASAGAANAVPDGTGAAGARWASPVVRVAVDSSTTDIDPVALDSIVDSITAWQAQAPNLPTIVVERAQAGCRVGYNTSGENSNCVLFARGGAPIAKGALAITVITFDQTSGQILDADIVINGEHRFGDAVTMSAKQSASAYDLQNVLTHEFGHFLGLGEDFDHQHATMFAYSLPGETEKRDLEDSDRVAISQLYKEPPAQESPSAGCGASVAGATSHRGLVAVFVCVGSFIVACQRRRATALALSLLGLCLTTSSAFQGPSNGVVSEVSALHSRWDGGLIVTTIELKKANCAACATEKVSYLGGELGGVSQQVGLLTPLHVGDQVVRGSGANVLSKRHGEPLLWLSKE